MPFDTTPHAVSLISAAVFRPGQEEIGFDRQVPTVPGALTYKTVTKEIGRKGLRYKDEATLLALMVTHRLLADQPKRSQSLNDATAVIVSSNFNNIDTVVQNARVIEEQHVDETSAMALPNASSNSVSATVAIVNQLRGINLMLCNGDDSGLDGFKLSRQLLASGRAQQVLLIGVEVTNAEVEALFPPAISRFHGAAAVLLGQEGDGASLRPTADAEHKSEVLLTRHDTEIRAGDSSGAEGVLRLALAHERTATFERVRFEANSGRSWELVRP